MNTVYKKKDEVKKEKPERGDKNGEKECWGMAGKE